MTFSIFICSGCFITLYILCTVVYNVFTFQLADDVWTRLDAARVILETAFREALENGLVPHDAYDYLFNTGNLCNLCDLVQVHN